MRAGRVGTCLDVPLRCEHNKHGTRARQIGPPYQSVHLARTKPNRPRVAVGGVVPGQHPVAAVGTAVYSQHGGGDEPPVDWWTEAVGSGRGQSRQPRELVRLSGPSRR